MKRVIVSLFVLTSVTVLAGCMGDQKIQSGEESRPVAAEKIADVEVALINREGREVGMALLKEREQGVEIIVEASQLPEGSHGFHVHEKGICEPADFTSAGGHFNPTNMEHGLDNPKGPHAGDIENLEVQADNMVNQTFFSELITLEKGAANSLVQEEGTSLIIHADPDDYVSQPAGDAGERIVCGVISKQVKQ